MEKYFFAVTLSSLLFIFGCDNVNNSKYRVRSIYKIDMPSVGLCELYDLDWINERGKSNTVLSLTRGGKGAEIISINRPGTYEPLVSISDTNFDGNYNNIEYTKYDSNGKVLFTTIDMNLDGYPDLKAEHGEELKVWIWIGEHWHRFKGKEGKSEKRFAKINDAWREIYFDNGWKYKK